MSKLVAIDTMVLVWGVRGEGTEEQVRRAARFYAHAEAEQWEVMVPSVVLAEYLFPVPTESQTQVVADVVERFHVFPFDVRCAAVAARLAAGRMTQEDRDGTRSDRRVIKADSQIVATAFVHGASVMYSEDRAFQNMARMIMNAERLPEIGPHLWA